MAEDEWISTQHLDDAVRACGYGLALAWPAHDEGSRVVGEVGENLAADHFASHGYRMLDRNWRSGRHDLRGELDVVCFDPASRTLIVGEVKTRHHPTFGGSLVSLAPGQQRRIRRLAAARIAAGVPGFEEVRFDLVGIDVDEGSGRRTARLTHVVAAW